MMRGYVTIATAALALLAAASEAQAQTAHRAWVSGHGVDQAGCGGPATPCRSLQFAHDNIVAAGGEIDILDPAGYGAVTITKAVSIVNDGVGTAGVQSSAGSNAITINAGANDGVYLRGLNLDGVQNTGRAGIQFSNGRSLTVVNCVVRHFNGPGIAIDGAGPATTAMISNTSVSDNAGPGVSFSTPTTGTGVLSATVDHVVSSQNQYGFSLDIQNASSVNTKVVISNVVASHNSVDGVSATASSPGGLTMLVDTAYLTTNGTSGLAVGGLLAVFLSRSFLALNGVYGLDDAAPANVITEGNNSIVANGAANVNPGGQQLQHTDPLQ